MTARDLLDSHITEAELQSAVLDLAKAGGWRVHHCTAAVMKSGRWGTPIQGDAGFPDLVLVRPPELLFVELKSAKGRLTHEQAAWVDAINRTNTPVLVWRPEDLDQIALVLATRPGSS